MKIEFDSGTAGYHEARELKRMVEHWVDSGDEAAHVSGLVDFLTGLAEAQLQKPEFAELRETEADDGGEDAGHRHGGLRSALNGLLGPSRREMMLSQQRIDALDRAQRAEAVSFDALAETAKVGRERDQALQRIKALEAELAELKAKLGST